ncbi:helix-turn-helix domain-containing protein [Microbacterium sp. cx-59]|uniref:PucR family transcriptional regulator n=1 Tax=Microbacterium sp. cx-59 TaxID=2891207 RepID=UPI001E4C74BF|nr:helix-turn-helix domain-containing protein [Microbacterium sp. cx-59]MCC4907324.1 helix-turn-helix domain-containing protein [Microbacterium sp. cx-59]
MDQLAATLARSVLVGDLAHRPLAWSVQYDDIDDIRTDALLKRYTPRDVRTHLDRLALADVHRPLTISLEPFGGRERLAVPIERGGRRTATLWLITGGMPPLSGRDLAAIDTAAELMAETLSVPTDDVFGADRRSTMSQLLSSDAPQARRAFAEASSRGWIHPRDGLTVIAAGVPDPANGVERASLGVRLGARVAGSTFLGANASMLFVLAATAAARDTARSLRHAAARDGTDVLGMGLSAIDPDAESALPAADRAARAADIVSRMPTLGPQADITDIGPWAFLHRTRDDADDVPSFSAAASLLVREGNETAREPVEVYLDEGGNARRACARLHLHRTSLYYRLDRLPALVKNALDDGLSRSTLHLCLKLHRFAEQRVLR